MAQLVRDETTKRRYELLIDDQLAGIVNYRLTGDHIALTHAEIFDGFLHQGFATSMVTEVLDDARRRSLGVLPMCPFVLTLISEHPDDYLDLVPADQRARFGLPS
jgi:predicted GNAT family acetyltransferase